MSPFTAILLLSSAIGASASAQRIWTTVEDAHDQEELISCYEPIDKTNSSAGWHVSEPIYTLCSIMPHPMDDNIVFVNGIDSKSDDYSNILRFFKKVHHAYEMLSACVQEGFQLYPEGPSQITVRCFCKRSACNIPEPLLSFLDFNKNVIPKKM